MTATITQPLFEFVQRHYRRNRTTVSSEIMPILEDAAKLTGLPLKVHRFPSGSDIATWVVPERWDVREAWLRGPDGTLIASYEQHPLFVAPYSMPFSGRLPRAELLKHVRSHEGERDAFFYEHRLAYDFRRQLKEWIITLPRNVVDTLPDGDYEVHLDFDIGPGEMLVGAITLPGETSEEIALLSDYCHPGQVNDSFSGLIAMIGVMWRLIAQPRRRFTYTMYIFPETIGSCVLLGSDPSIAARTKLAIFSECVGWGDRWVLSVSDKPGSTADMVARDAARRHDKTTVAGLEAGWGNDEHVFDYAGVPSLAVQMYEFPEYHSSNDAPDRLRASCLTEAIDMISGMCLALEDDRVYARVQNVPVYMTRYGVYRDAVNDREGFRNQRRIINAIDGRRSILNIAADLNLPQPEVKAVTNMFSQHGLLREVK